MDIKTAARTLDIFECFEAAGKPLSLSELAAQIDAPVSSCHGLVRTLKSRGYLYTVSGRSTLYPTKRLLKIASSIARNDPVLAQLRPILEGLRDRTRETVILGKRQDDSVVYLDVLEGPQTIRYSAQPGRIIPLHSSSIGKAVLGLMSDTDLRNFLEKWPSLEKVTSRTITAPDCIIEDIRQSRVRGYFLTRGENVADVMAIARMIRTPSGDFGIAIAGPLHRMSEAVDLFAETLENACMVAIET